jgi:hypothetical protein
VERHASGRPPRACLVILADWRCDIATVYKVLGQVEPAATTQTTLYTVPAATEAVVSTITICNRGAAATYRIAVRASGAALADQHYIAYGANLGAGETEIMTIGLTLEATTIIAVYASHADVAFGVFGSEITA